MIPFLCLVVLLVNVIDLAKSLQVLQVSIEGSRIIGEELNMTCSIINLQKPPLLSNSTEIVMTLEKKDADQGSGIVFNGNNVQTSVQLNFNPLQYSDRGSYICTTSLVKSSNTSITIVDEFFIEYNLTLKLPVPVSSVQISVPVHSPIFIGEHVLLTCNYTAMQISLNISYTSTISWRRGNALVSENSVLVHKNQTKHAYELSDIVDSSSVKYTCEIELVPEIDDPFLTGVNYTNDLILYSKDPPILKISHRGNAGVLDGPYSIDCTTMAAACNDTIIDLVWFKVGYPGNINFIYKLNATTKSPNFVKLHFNELSMDDAGTYICKAIVNNKRVITVIETQLLLTTPFNVSLKQGTPFYLLMTWSTPLSFKGHAMVNYTITTNITGSLVVPLVSNTADSVLYNITGLHPFQYVAVTITAQSEADEGDPISIVLVTSEYVPAPVTGLFVSRIDNFSVLVTWEPVPPAKANGILLGYLINVYNSSLPQRQLVTAATLNDTSIIIMKLVPKTRYSIEVISRNSNYQSDPAQTTFYTVEGALAPPMDINVQILNYTHIMITWVGIHDMKGSVQSYIIMMADRRTFTVSPLDEHGLVVDAIVDDTRIYGFRIATVNGDRVRGPWSPWITNAESSYIQLRGGTFKSCTKWSDGDRLSIISLFRQSLMNFTNSSCKCDGPAVVYTNDTVLCDPTTPTDAVYRTSITGIFPYTTNKLIELIIHWIMSGVTIASGITQVTLNPHCPVVIETANEPLCQPTSEDEAKPEGGAEVILVTVLLVVVVLSCTIVFIICAYIITWRSQRIQTWRFVPCPTPEGHPWVQDQKEQLQNVSTMFANTSIGGFDGEDEEEVQSTCEEGAGSPCKDNYDQTDEGERDLESGVYDPSNLTIIYESDHESTKL